MCVASRQIVYGNLCLFISHLGIFVTILLLEVEVEEELEWQDTRFFCGGWELFGNEFLIRMRRNNGWWVFILS